MEEKMKEAMSIMMDYAEAYDEMGQEDEGPDPIDAIKRIAQALSGICVEVKKLDFKCVRVDAVIAETPVGPRYSVRKSVTHPGSFRAYYDGGTLMDNIPDEGLARYVCQADFTSRISSSLKTRTVEEARQEYLDELIAGLRGATAVTEDGTRARRQGESAHEFGARMRDWEGALRFLHSLHQEGNADD